MRRTAHENKSANLRPTDIITLYKILADVHRLLKVRTHHTKNLFLFQGQVKFDILSFLILAEISKIGDYIFVIFEGKLIFGILGISLHCITKHFFFLSILQITVDAIVFLQIWYKNIVHDSIIKILPAKIVVAFGIEDLHNTIFYL